MFKTTRMTLMIEEEFHREVKKHAFECYSSVSSLVRKLLKEDIERRKKELAKK